MRRIITLFCLMLCGIGAFAQTSGGLPPVRKVEPTKPSLPPQSSPQPQSEIRNSTIDPEPFDPNSLINEGWKTFIGAAGIVDEKKAFDLTLGGINSLDPNVYERAISIGRNNLSVFYLCAQDPRVRDFRKGMKLKAGRDFRDNMSLDNLVWDVYLQRERAKDLSDFYLVLKKDFPAHPVNGYVDSLGGKAPESTEHAYAVLERFANDGDPYAAMRIGYRYECYERAPELNLAISWYRKAKDLHERNNASERTIKSTADRINRLVLISEGKSVK